MSARIYAGLGPFRDTIIGDGSWRRERGAAASLVDAVRRAGFDGLEINPFGLDVARRAGIEMRIEDLAPVELSLHSNFVDFSLASPNPYVRRAAVEQLHDELALAEKHGIRVITFHPGVVRKVDRSTAMELFWESLSFVANHGRPVQLCLENMDHKDEKLCNRQDEISATLERFPSLRLTVDLAHLGLRGEDIGSFLDQFEHSVSHVHVSGVTPGTPHSKVSLAASSIDLRPHIERLADRDLAIVIENGDRATLEESLTVIAPLIR